MEQQHPLGRGDPVLAGVPANLATLVAGRATPSGSGGRPTCCPTWVLTEKGRSWRSRSRRVTGSTPPSRWRSPSPCRRCTSWRWRALATTPCATSRGMIWCSPWRARGHSRQRADAGSAGEGNIAGLEQPGSGAGLRPGGGAEHRRRRWRQGARLASQEVEVSIAGSGEVEVRAQSRLKVEIAGTGAVSYWGSPELTSEIAGSGQVSRLGS